MGKVQIFTQEQQFILAEVVKNDFLTSHFYFTGGTALSALYLHHRYSEDLDFFTENKFDTQIIFTFMDELCKKNRILFTSRLVETVHIFILTINEVSVKVDFAHYPYRRVEKGTNYQGIEVDSLLDIAINKLLTLSQRTDVKDFVDAYFLLQKFPVWDLMEGVRVKFGMEVEPLLLASDFLKVEDFEFLPRMITPLSLEELKSFFREQAKTIGRRSVE